MELKNINSFRFVKQAIEYEIARQVELIESGGKVVQETRLWDTARARRARMRSKEEAHDYRYFPEPDLPPLASCRVRGAIERRALPELPRAKLQRFMSQYGLPAYDAKILFAERALADFFEAVRAALQGHKKLSNWFLGELLAPAEGGGAASVATLRFTPAQFGGCWRRWRRATLSNNAAKDVFGEMFRTGQGAGDDHRRRRACAGQRRGRRGGGGGRGPREERRRGGEVPRGQEADSTASSWAR